MHNFAQIVVFAAFDEHHVASGVLIPLVNDLRNLEISRCERTSATRTELFAMPHFQAVESVLLQLLHLVNHVYAITVEIFVLLQLF